MTSIAHVLFWFCFCLFVVAFVYRAFSDSLDTVLYINFRACEGSYTPDDLLCDLREPAAPNQSLHEAAVVNDTNDLREPLLDHGSLPPDDDYDGQETEANPNHDDTGTVETTPQQPETV